MATKNAWEQYFRAALDYGLLELPAGDLVGRLRELDGPNFRSAMAECLSCWFLSVQLGLEVHAAPGGRLGRKLDMEVVVSGTAVGVEVKSPSRIHVGGVWAGDDSDLIEKALAESNKQLSDVCPNIVVLVPELFPPFSMHRSALVSALIGHERIIWDVDVQTGEAVSEPRSKFVPDGKFTKFIKPGRQPAHTRVSAIILIEQHLQRVPVRNLLWWHHWKTAMACTALVAHNPFAKHPIDESVFRMWPQLVVRGNTMVWTAGSEGVENGYA
jgi:hypothetical protein